MHSGTVRFLELSSILLTAFFTLAFIAASSTILRVKVLNPQPVADHFSVTFSAPIRSNVTSELYNGSSLDPSSVYYVPPSQLQVVQRNTEEEATWRKEMRKSSRGPPVKRRYASPSEEVDQKKRIETGVHEKKAEQQALLGQWEPHQWVYEGSYCHSTRLFTEKGFPQTCAGLSQDIVALIREVDEVLVHVSGVLDFSSCWDWNTKAIYVSVLVSYATPSTPQNEVNVVDIVLRPSPLRRSWTSALRNFFSLDDARAPWDSPTLTDKEYRAHLRSLRNSHDPDGALQDPYKKLVFLNNAWKYKWLSYHSGTLPFRLVDVKVRYQVMSYSGWAPVKEMHFSAGNGSSLQVQVPRYDLLHDLDAVEFVESTQGTGMMGM